MNEWTHNAHLQNGGTQNMGSMVLVFELIDNLFTNLRSRKNLEESK